VIIEPHDHIKIAESEQSERVYYPSKWSKKDLDDKPVQFVLSAPLTGLKALEDFESISTGGLLSIDILVDHPEAKCVNHHHICGNS
jgi:hypothetical protein